MVSALLARPRFPLVEPAGVTFVYHGAAEAVRLHHWLRGLPSGLPLERAPGTDLWRRFVALPPGSRLEYKFEVVEHGVGRWITDPLNPELARDPFGVNSVCAAFGYARPSWTIADPAAAAGSVDERRLFSTVFDDERTCRVYLPARFRRSRRYPLLIVHDGSDFLHYADLKIVLDNLIHRRAVAPLIVALSDPVDRLAEYRGGAEHARFVVSELLPRLGAELPLLETPGARGLMGASLGAIASLATAWRYQGVFGRLLLQSGSFVLTDCGPRRRDAVFDPVVAFMAAWRADPGRPAARAYVSCGLYEGLIDENRALVPLLGAQEVEVRYEEARDGHHWTNWRDRLLGALSWLFPPGRAVR
jgi:enterochelin esterase family protein